MASDHLLVVLVHGTRPRLFGRDLMAAPTWTKRDSAFRKILADSLGEQPRFIEFEWTGANTHAARLAASAPLADLLRQLRRERPAARLVLVAHSHGGNVALYAMRLIAGDGTARPPVDALVCLGTPFLRATLRDLPAVFARLRVSVYWGVLVALLTLTMSTAFVLEQWSLTAATVAAVAGMVAFVAWKFSGKLLVERYFTGPMVDGLTVKARALAAAVDCRPTFNSPPILVLKSERDEAKLWLTLLDRSASLLSGERLLQWTSRSILVGANFFDWLESRGVAWALSVAVVLFLRALGSGDWNASIVKGLVFAPAAALILVSLSHSLLFITIVLTLRGSTLAFGQSLFLSLMASISANDQITEDEHPSVRVMTLTLPPRVFHHASFYVDPPAIEAIGAWLNAARAASASLPG